MATLSLRELAGRLGSNQVSGMAQKVGLHWPPPPSISVRNLFRLAGTAFVLSGGGAKGSFEVGALKYLYQTGVRPQIICATSVGAINGLKLAEGEGEPHQGFQGLEQIWLNMKTDSDMYVEDSWIQTQPQWIKDAIRGAGSSPDWFQTLLLVLIPGLAAEKLKDLADFVDTAKIAHGMYNLQPIQDSVQKNVNFDLLGRIKLRMATVGLQSGAVKYVTELGRLVDDPALLSDDQNSPQVDITRGMLASAAIPLFFEMQQLAGDWYVDGGLRQIAPIQAAIAMGATEVYAVVAPVPLAPDTDYTHKGLVDIGTRAATEITIDQITTNNIYPFGGWGVPVFVIRPNVEVEPSRTIDPGLIRINMAYGYMRAYDIVSQRASDPNVKAALISLSDEIARTRLQIWKLEGDAINYAILVSQLPGVEQLTGTPLPGPPFSDFIDYVNDFRYLKQILMGLLACRLSIAGPESLPSDASNWAMSWEAHYGEGVGNEFRGAELWIESSPWVGFFGIPAVDPQPIPPPDGCPRFT